MRTRQAELKSTIPQDTVANSPIERIGTQKNPMTPRDRLGNRYIVNLVDHKSNYANLFLAHTKVKAAKFFKDFFVHFDKRFDCRTHVLRTDSGGEFAKDNLFCD